MSNQTTKEDMRKGNQFFFNLLRKPEKLPVSFIVGGKEYRGMPEDAHVEESFLDSNIVRTVYTADIEGLTFRTEILNYRDFSAAEWTVYVTYSGQAESELLEDLMPANILFNGADAHVISCNGDFYSDEGYTNVSHDLSCGKFFSQAPVGGRPCDQAFPFQRLLFDGYGFNIAIGWPGQWKCTYEGQKDGVVFKAGQEKVHTVLRKGEVFRSPRMAVVFFEGGLERGINVWRRFYREHIMPKADGMPLPSYLMSHETGGGLEFIDSNEKNQIAAIDEHVRYQIPVNLWWIDAGWYPARMPDGTPDWWKTTGTWECDKERYPKEFVPLIPHLQAAGMDLLVWFEVERTNPGTFIFENHPEWILHSKQDDDQTAEFYSKYHIAECTDSEAGPDSALYGQMLNMGDKDCVDWLCRTISEFLIRNHISIYRQDYNFEPLDYWRHNEAENRGGMVENQYIQGYLRYLDYLLLTVPGLRIDACASGGRRNDLETMKRGVPCHHTDRSYGNAPIQQSFDTTMLSWLPYYRGYVTHWEKPDGTYAAPDFYNTFDKQIDAFTVLHSIAPVTSWGDLIDQYKNDPEKLLLMQKSARICHFVAPYMIYADYYVLVDCHKSRFAWTVWQFDKPEDGTGVFRVVSNNGVEEGGILVYPRALRGSTWRLTNLMNGEERIIDGNAAEIDGVKFEQPPRTVAFWAYRRAD